MSKKLTAAETDHNRMIPISIQAIRGISVEYRLMGDVKSLFYLQIAMPKPFSFSSHHFLFCGRLWCWGVVSWRKGHFKRHYRNRASIAGPYRALSLSILWQVARTTIYLDNGPIQNAIAWQHHYKVYVPPIEAVLILSIMRMTMRRCILDDHTTWHFNLAMLQQILRHLKWEINLAYFQLFADYGKMYLIRTVYAQPMGTGSASYRKNEATQNKHFKTRLASCTTSVYSILFLKVLRRQRWFAGWRRSHRVERFSCFLSWPTTSRLPSGKILITFHNVKP